MTVKTEWNSSHNGPYNNKACKGTTRTHRMQPPSQKDVRNGGRIYSQLLLQRYVGEMELRRSKIVIIALATPVHVSLMQPDNERYSVHFTPLEIIKVTV